MKRILYTILPLLLLTAACVREIPNDMDEVITEPTVPIVISLAQPVTLQATDATKVVDMLMADTPSIANIHVAVFGSSGYLKDYVSAVPCDSEGNAISNFAQANNTASYFLVRLPVSTSRRIVHIIANGPSSLEFNAYEGDIMKSLSVTDGIGAYWQRMDLTGGITVETTTNTAGQTVYEQDPNGEYIPTSATIAAFSNIKLVRNFAGITVTDSADNFQLISYVLCNMPKSGTIAIYSTEHNDWMSDYWSHAIDAGTGLMTFSGHNYAGFPTDPELDTYIPDTEAGFNAASVSEGETTYIYERAAVRDNPPFVLMKARWVEAGDPSGATPKYYRLDITKNNDYFPLYRNYKYSLDIIGCDVQGYDSPGTAAQHNSGSNFSVSLDTQELNEVANSKVRLHVDKTNYDILYTADTQEFWFKFIKNEGNVNLNGNVTVTELTGGNALDSYTLESSDRADDKRYVTFTLNEPGSDDVLTSTLRILGSYTDGGKDYRLTREINIRTVKPRSSTPTLNPDTVAPVADQTTTLTVPLPLDMPKSMFPMEFLIEDSAKALNPASTEDMPVKSGILSLTDNTTPSYCFVRTLNWSEYERLVNDAVLSGDSSASLTCKFVTTKAFSGTTIYVANEFFSKTAGVSDAKVDLNADADDYIAPNDQTFSGTSAHVDVNASGNWILSISLANGNAATGVSMSPASGTSTGGTPQDVTLTFAENDSENAIRYKLTLTNSDTDETRIAYITQEGVSMSLRIAPSATVPVDYSGANNFPVKVNSGGHYILKTLDSDGNVLWTSATTYDPTVSETDREVIIPATDLNTTRQVTIRLVNTYGTIKKEVKVTQSAGTATLSLAESEIRMGTTSNSATVTTNISTVLKVYDEDNGGDPVTINPPYSTPQAITIGANTTGATRHFRVDLCNASGRVLDTKSFTQISVPALYLTAASTSIGNNDTTVSLNVDSDAAWTASVSGGLGTATVSPSSGSAGNTNAVTLTVPVNNTTSAQTYTVTAGNGSSTKSVTITQAAGVASLAIASENQEIMMQESSTTVSVTTSFATVLKVFNAATDALVQEQNLASTGSVASNKTVTVGTASGTTPINYRVELWNNTTKVAGPVTFTQKPMIRISAPNASVKGNENASVNVISDVDWTLTVNNGGSVGTYSGTATTGAENVTVNMPVNYTTSNVDFTVTASNTSLSLEDSVVITHRAATLRTGQTVTFPCGTGRTYSSSVLTDVRNGITATFEGTLNSTSSTAHIRFDSGTKLHFTTDNTVIYEITGASFVFTGNNYRPQSGSVSNGTMSWGTTTTWTKSGTDPVTSLDIEFTRTGLYTTFRLSSFEVTYTDYQWN